MRAPRGAPVLFSERLPAAGGLRSAAAAQSVRTERYVDPGTFDDYLFCKNNALTSHPGKKSSEFRHFWLQFRPRSAELVSPTDIVDPKREHQARWVYFLREC